MRLLERLSLALVFAVVTASPALADGILNCGLNGAACSISLSIDGDVLDTTTYDIDSSSGDLSLSDPLQVQTNGSTLSIDSIYGNADPILGFGIGAGTGGAGGAFSVTLTLPIALTGLINANSQVSYSLTSLTSAGAQISPLGGNVVIGQELDTSVGGLSPLNKGVDVGNTFVIVGGPSSMGSPTYTATNQFVGDLAYDLMSVTVAFQLSANSNVGISGFVQQELPEPGTSALLGLGLVAVLVARRR